MCLLANLLELQLLLVCKSLRLLYLISYRFNSLNAGYCLMVFLPFADFSKLTFSKTSFRYTIRVSNGLDQDQTDILSVLIWVQTVCKGYQQTSKVATYSKERVSAKLCACIKLFC